MTQRWWSGLLLPGTHTPGEEERYPGERFGLPEEGPRSVASMGRRLLALLIDWLLSLLIARTFFGHSDVTVITLLIFAAEVYLLTALTGYTVGKRVCGLRVARLDGKPVGLGWALVRTLLLLAVTAASASAGSLHNPGRRTACSSPPDPRSSCQIGSGSASAS